MMCTHERERVKKLQQNWLSIMVFLGPVKLTTEHDSYDPNAEILQSKTHVSRRLDTVFLGQYLPSLSINYVAISKDLEELPPQLY